MSHGARFGDGRYVSPDLSVAARYTLSDSTCKQQVLLCLTQTLTLAGGAPYPNPDLNPTQPGTAVPGGARPHRAPRRQL